MDYLRDTLQWPSSQIFLGERFDVLLLEQDLHPVVNIETKAPEHVASSTEIRDFETRLTFYGTLRWAFFTNGNEWWRLELYAPNGRQTIRERKSLSIRTTNETIAVDYFDPLTPKHYLV